MRQLSIEVKMQWIENLSQLYRRQQLENIILYSRLLKGPDMKNLKQFNVEN